MLLPTLSTALAPLTCTLPPIELDDPNVTVVDAATGDPVAGAEVLGVHEREAPVWGRLWSRVSATTDAEGRAHLPPPTEAEPYGWRVVRAPGYAISGAMEVPREDGGIEVELSPSIPARVRLVDFLGRPLPLVHMGLCVGCGHTPDVEQHVTDREGWVTFHGVGAEPSRGIADVYPVGDGVVTDYLGVDWDAAQEGGFTATGEPGATLTGTLLMPDGRPAAGYFLGTNGIHRGPWTETDDEGRFRFHGVPAGHCGFLRVKDPSGESIGDFEGSRMGMERTLQLPEEPWGDERTGPVGKLALSLDLAGDAERLELAWESGTIPVEVWDPRTGWAQLLEVPLGELHEVELVAGDYGVEIGGKGTPFERVTLGRVSVPEGRNAVAVVRRRVDTPRIVSLEVQGRADAGRITVRTASGEARHLEFDAVAHGGARGPAGVLEHFAVPAESFGLWVESKRADRDLERLVVTRVAEGEWSAHVD